ncbi:hypothetical protein Tco_0330585, partial [Tanacetum coccineum]
MAFVTTSGFSSTNNTANPTNDVSTGSSKVNTASSSVSTANISDNVVFEVAALSAEYKSKEIRKFSSMLMIVL